MKNICGVILIATLLMTSTMSAVSGSLPAEDEDQGQPVIIIPDDGYSRDLFGKTLDLSQNYMIAGAPEDDNLGPESGSAYVFEHSGKTWHQAAKLTADDGHAGDRFGYSVALSGDYAIVGACLDDDKGYDSGSAYIFIRSGGIWRSMAKLTPDDGTSGDRFGHSVSISGNVAIVGASYQDEKGYNSGAAYIFRLKDGSWHQEARLIPEDGEPNDQFGCCVTISEKHAVIGAFQDDDNGENSGAAYVFSLENGSWVQQAKLTASDGTAHERFGISAAISGNLVIIGADRDDDNGPDSGSAYIFKRAGASWNQSHKLIPVDGDSNDHFGHSVALKGNHAVVGSYQDDDREYNAGAVYRFRLEGSTWSWLQKLTLPDGKPMEYLGGSVALSDKFIAAGVHGSGIQGPDSGSVRIFSITDSHLQLKKHTKTGQVQTLFRETFSKGNTEGWETGDSNTENGEDFWGVIQDGKFAPQAWCSARSDGGSRLWQRYDNHMNAFMKRTVSLSGWKNCRLTFDYYLDTGSDDRLLVLVDGARIWEATGFHDWSRHPSEIIDLSPYDNRSVQIEFIFESGHEDSSNMGAFIDNIRVTGQKDDDDAALKPIPLPAEGPYGYGLEGVQPGKDQAVFSFNGMKENAVVTFESYDIDTFTEVEILLNGQSVGHVLPTKGSTWGNSQEIILEDDLINDDATNILVFKNTDSSLNRHSWGIRKIRITPRRTPPKHAVTLPAKGAYGLWVPKETTPGGSHINQADFIFPGSPGDMLLRFEGFDVDTPTEVEILLNDVSVGYASTTPNNKYGQPEVVTLPDNLIHDSSFNLLVFNCTHNPPKKWKWGVRNISVSPVKPVVREKTAETGPITLPAKEAYGHGIQAGQQRRTQAEFIFGGQNGDAILTYEAWGIDNAAEVEITLNGRLLGHAPTTPDSEWGTTQEIVIRDDLIYDLTRNTLIFRQVDAPAEGSSWGVRNVDVRVPPEYAVTLPAKGAYGKEVPEGIASVTREWNKAEFSFPGMNGDVFLTFEAFDVDAPDEIEILINGTSVGYAARTADKQFGKPEVIILPDHLVNDVSFNLVVFYRELDPRRILQWGVRNIAVSSTRPVLDTETEVTASPVQKGSRYPSTEGSGVSPDDVVFTFPGRPGNTVISYEAFVGDGAGEIEILINGKPVGLVEPAPGNGWGSPVLLMLPDGIVKNSGENRLLFRGNINPAPVKRWGVRNITIVDPGAETPGAGSKAEKKTVSPGIDFHKEGRHSRGDH